MLQNLFRLIQLAGSLSLLNLAFPLPTLPLCSLSESVASSLGCGFSIFPPQAHSTHCTHVFESPSSNASGGLCCGEGILQHKTFYCHPYNLKMPPRGLLLKYLVTEHNQV